MPCSWQTQLQRPSVYMLFRVTEIEVVIVHLEIINTCVQIRMYFLFMTFLSFIFHSITPLFYVQDTLQQQFCIYSENLRIHNSFPVIWECSEQIPWDRSFLPMLGLLSLTLLVHSGIPSCLIPRHMKLFKGFS